MRSYAAQIGCNAVVRMAGLLLALGANSPVFGDGFTVRQSIEMRHFSDPEGQQPGAPVNMSPDGHYVAVVVSRGVIESDEIESTLLLFDVDEVRRFLHGPNRAPPRGMRLAVLASCPRMSQGVAYSSIITSVRWSKDSRSLYFLGEGQALGRRLYRVNAKGGAVMALTGANHDIGVFDIGKTAVAYLASDTIKSKAFANAHGAINADARYVTGLSLASIVFPAEPSSLADSVHLWMIERGAARKVVEPSSSPESQRGLSAKSSGREVFSLSPNGRSLITLTRVADVPATWSTMYAWGSDAYKKAWADHLRDGDDRFNAPRQYSLIDLESGKIDPLIDAPLSFSFGYPDMPKAIWSRDGKSVLITATFLPQGQSEPVKNQSALGPCSAAMVVVSTRKASCVAASTLHADESDSTASKRMLIDAEFASVDEGAKLIFIDMDAANRRLIERFQFSNGEWQHAPMMSMDGYESSGGQALEANRLRNAEISIWIKQDLDLPPTLWAADSKTGESKLLWNPNPQLGDVKFGRASLFRWTDPTGYEWTGGLVTPMDYVPGNRYPLVIQTYSFDPHQFLADGMDPTAEAAMPLANAGFFVLQIERRSDRAETPDEATEQIPGFESAIKQLTSEGLVDPKRVGIIGFSRGCYYVAVTLVRAPELIAAATVADGWDQSYMQHRMFDEAAIQDGPIYGVQPNGDGLRTWIREAPGFNLVKVRAPLRIEAIRQSSVLSEWELYSTLREQKKPVDLVYYPTGKHILQKPLERLASQQGDVDWFRFWLQGYEDPATEKAEQYRRWEKFCGLQKEQNPGSPTFCVDRKDR